MGGKSDQKYEFKNIWNGFPVLDKPEYVSELRNYMLISFGYHIKSMYTLISENLKS